MKTTVYGEATPVAEIAQVILKERQGRDRGWFEQQAACFHPDSRVRISWHDGSGAEFVRLSKEAYSRSRVRPNHKMASPVVHLSGDRAVAEVGAVISVAQDFEGVEAYVVSQTRLLYRLTRLDGRWGISAMDCIYERDELVPVVFGESPKLDPEILARFRRPYMYLAYHLHLAGRTFNEGMYGDDRPEELAALYEEAFEWMRGR